MPRTKGSKNKKSLTVDYVALIAEKQAEKDAAANEIAAVAANIEELKAELKSRRLPQRSSTRSWLNWRPRRPLLRLRLLRLQSVVRQRPC